MSTDATPRAAAWVAMSGAVLVGVLTALQARVNGQLGVKLEDGVSAAAISFISGFVVLAALSLVLPVGRAGWRALVAGIRARSIPVWMLAGGLAGALTVATQGLAVGIIGVALFTVGIVAGQTLSGLVLDRIGYGPGGSVAVTIPRVSGAALALAAVIFSVTQAHTGAVPLWMLILPFISGAGIAWQQATNGRLRQRVGTPLTATMVNFAGGSIVLAIAAAIHLAIAGPPRHIPVEAWIYTGGVIGVVYIFLSAALVSRTGVLLLGLGTVVGQLITATTMDLLWPAPASPGLVVELVTLVIALCSVVVVIAPWHRWRSR